MSFNLVYVTTRCEEEACALGRDLVEARLAAGANVIPGATSFFWWEGAVREAAEAVLIAKTRDDLVEAVIERVRARHSYDCPGIIALPIRTGLRAYLDWIGTETREV